MFQPAIWSLVLLLGSLPQRSAPAPSVRPSLRISGTVVDALSRQPLPRAEVSIALAGNRALSQTMRTAGDGRFLFESLAPGKYQLTARRRGYAPQDFQQHERFSTAIAVGPGLESEYLVFALRPEATISGQVSDELGDGVRNAQLMLFQQTLQAGRRTTVGQGHVATDDLGHYRFPHLMPGTYFVVVSTHPWYAGRSAQMRVRTGDTSATGDVSLTDEEPHQIIEENTALDVVYPLTYFSNASDPEGASPITLRSGDVATADFVLQPISSHHLRIRVAEADPSQPHNVEVTQQSIGGGEIPVPAQTAEVGAGFIEITGLPPGRLNISVTSSDEKSSATFTHFDVSRDTEIDVRDGSALPVIAGEVKLEGAPALPRPATLFLRNRATGETDSAETLPDGTFAFVRGLAVPATVDLSASGEADLYVKSIVATGAKVSGQTLELSRAQDVRLTVTLAQGLGKVDGIALQDGKPKAGVMVVLIPPDLEKDALLVRRDQSDSDGTFTLPSIVPGKYTVVAIENGWDLQWADPQVLQKYLAAGETVQVDPGQNCNIQVKVQ